MSLTVGLGYIISSSDRYIIAYYLGEGAAGVYSVAVDFTSQTLTLLLMTISLAIVPLAMRSWENDDHEAHACICGTTPRCSWRWESPQ